MQYEEVELYVQQVKKSAYDRISRNVSKSSRLKKFYLNALQRVSHGIFDHLRSEFPELNKKADYENLFCVT